MVTLGGDAGWGMREGRGKEVGEKMAGGKGRRRGMERKTETRRVLEDGRVFHLGKTARAQMGRGHCRRWGRQRWEG